MKFRIGAALIAAALGSLALATPSGAKPKDKEAAFKLLSASGTQTHTFFEDGTRGGTQPGRCVGSQSLRIQFHTTTPTKMYVFLREAHGLHTLVSGKPKPESGLDFLSVPGEMTLSRSVSYEAIDGCGRPPVECPETILKTTLFVRGSHEKSGGISALYDTNVALPPGLDETCAPRPGAESGPLSPGAVQAETTIPFPGAISWSQLFNEKRKRLSGEDSEAFDYQTTSPPGSTSQVTVTGTYGETVAVELKRLKPKKN